jgi:hypothetical protein
LELSNNSSKIGELESGILPDGEGIITAASFGFITGARIVALAIRKLNATNGRTAVTDTIVLETSVPEAVTLALGNTLLDSHVVLVLTGAVDECTTHMTLNTIHVTSR